MGQVEALWRHPIKAHGRETLPQLTLTEGQTIPWDRRWAVTHEAAKADGSDWAPCVNFSRGSKVGALMAINAQSHEDSGQITLTHPEQPALTFSPDNQEDVQRFLDWVKPLMPEDRAQSSGIIRVEGRGMTDTDYPSVSLLNLASNQAMTDLMGQDISPLRWRCNIHLSGFAAWEEFGWIGKTLQVGEVRLAIREPIVRCLATTANPLTGRRDADTLATLKEQMGHQDFGVYAEVIRGGNIRTGDTAEVI